MIKNKKRIVLASKSPRRKDILQEFGFEVVVMEPQGVLEVSMRDGVGSPEEVVLENARRKAWSVGVEGELVLASDTIVMLGAKEFGKPRNEKEAFLFLEELSGKAHRVYSSYYLKYGDWIREGVDYSEVFFKKLFRDDILEYMDRVHVMDKAGAYAIQDGGESIVDHLNGSFYTVMGLPIERINDVLCELDEKR